MDFFRPYIKSLFPETISSGAKSIPTSFASKIKVNQEIFFEYHQIFFTVAALELHNSPLKNVFSRLKLTVSSIR